MDPYTPHEIFAPYTKGTADNVPSRADGTPTPAPTCAPAPRMVSHTAKDENDGAKSFYPEPARGGQSALQTHYQDLPPEIKRHLLALNLATKSPEECLAELRNYALVSRVAYHEVQHLLTKPEFLQVALHWTRHAVPKLAILPWKVASRHDEIVNRMQELATTYPQLYADLSRNAKVPRRILNSVQGWVPSYFFYHQPFSKPSPDRPTAVKALLAAKDLTFLQLKLDEGESTYGVSVSDKAVNEVCDFLNATATGTPTNLQLHLECRFLSSKDAANLLHTLSRCAAVSVIRGLNLEGSLPLPDHDSAERSQAIRNLGNFIAQNGSLRQLNLSGNDLTAAEAQILASALKANRGVVELHMDKNDIGEAGAVALAEVLSGESPIRILALGSNRIGPLGADALNIALKSNSTLELLYLGDNPIRHSTIWNDQETRLSLFRSPLVQSMPPMEITN